VGIHAVESGIGTHVGRPVAGAKDRGGFFFDGGGEDVEVGDDVGVGE
jgi:hypothetical protein